MVTLSVKEFDGTQRLLGTINKQPFNIIYSDEAKEAILSFGEQMEDADTVAAFNEIVKEAMDYLETTNVSIIEEVAGTDLVYDKQKNQYFLKAGNTVSKFPVHSLIVDKVQKAVDLGLDPSPWIKFWTRLMRNVNISQEKVEYIMNYVTSLFTDEEKVEQLMEDGYSEEMAKEIATFDQISITKEGLLAAFKYVKLKDTTKHVEIDKETGEQKIIETKQSLTEKGSISVDDNDNVVETPGANKLAEDLIFLPPVMGTGGSAFTCEPLSQQAKFEDYAGHVIRVGMRHRLENWSRVNCQDGTCCVAGLHVGGYHYVKGYGGRTSLLVDCLIDPAHIGAVTNKISNDGSHNGDAALRVLEYYVVGTHFTVNKSMYHPSSYAELLDKEWEAYKEEAINKANDALAEVEEW